jgi:putative transcriptional regulator
VTPIEIRLREIRTARGLSQQKLANKAGIPQSTVSRIETGKTSAIDFALVEKLCRALKCEPGDLIVRTRR